MRETGVTRARRDGVVGFFRRHRWARIVLPLAFVLIVSVLPVPWLVARTPDPPGMAWRLDGRLTFNGQTIDPPGVWVGLTAGRPPIVAEVVWSWIDPDVAAPRDMRSGSSFSSPALAEPAAIAIGLAEAGIEIAVTTLVEARDPLIDGLPPKVAVSRLNHQEISSSDDWMRSLAELGAENQFTTSEGRVFVFAGPTFPYRIVDMMQAPTDLDVSLAGWGSLIPVGWYRKLALGSSHGLLLAIAAYSHASGEDLASGRTIAGTGLIRSDGTVAPVGGLAAKVRAARRAGVDVMIYPATQICQMETTVAALGPSGMTTIPVSTLTEAIETLRGGGTQLVDATACAD